MIHFVDGPLDHAYVMFMEGQAPRVLSARPAPKFEYHMRTETRDREWIITEPVQREIYCLSADGTEYRHETRFLNPQFERVWPEVED